MIRMINKILKEELEQIKPSKSELNELNKLTNGFIEKLQAELKDEEHGGEIFVGGSFAKNTLIKKEAYDIDVFVRFSWKYDNISELLEKPLKRLAKKENLELNKIHGSRDYFRIYSKNHKAYFEIIPVTKIKKPSEGKNVTDLSYFHVSYVKKRMKKLSDQVLLAKAFCQAQKVYGAETYVRGFSGYSLELLVLHYKSFVKMLKELIKVKKGERIVIDIEKRYRRSKDVFFELNEAKLGTPIILVDPTYKERNALAALSFETFERFQDEARKFLKKPEKKFFEEKMLDSSSLEKFAKQKKAEFVHARIHTDKQAGDIAGTKLKKFHYLIEKEARKYFELLKHEFEYSGDQTADFYLVLKSKKEIFQIGPPMYKKKLRKYIKEFKEKHGKNVFLKNGIYHARVKVDFTGREFIRKLADDKDKLGQMHITKMEVN